MAFSGIATRGSATTTSSGTTLQMTVATANIAAGKIVIVGCATDNDSTAVSDGASTRHTSVTDSASNTYTKIAEYTDSDGTAADGVTNSLWYSVLTTGLTSGSSTITLTCASSVACKIICAIEATKESNGALSLAQVGVGQSAISATVSGLTSREYLLVGHGAAEGTDSSKTPDADYTERFDLRTSNTGSQIANHLVTRIATVTSDTCTSSAWTNTNPIFLLAAIYETRTYQFTGTITSSTSTTASLTVPTTYQFTGTINSATTTTAALNRQLSFSGTISCATSTGGAGETTGTYGNANESLSEVAQNDNFVLDSSIKNHGTYSFEGLGTGTTNFAMWQDLPDVTTDVYSRIYIYIPSDTTLTANAFLFEAVSGDWGSVFFMVLSQSSGVPNGIIGRLYDGLGEDSSSSLITQNFVLGQWMCFEVRTTIHPTDANGSGGELWINGDKVLTMLSANFTGGGTRGTQIYSRWGAWAGDGRLSSGKSIYFDDWVLHNAYIGPFVENVKLTLTKNLTGTVTTSTSTTSALIRNVALSGTIASSTSITASLDTVSDNNKYLTGTITTATSITASLIKNVALSGAIDTNTSTTSTLSTITQYEFTGTINSAVSTTGSLIKVFSLSGTIDTSSTTAAAIIKNVAITGTVSASISTSAQFLREIGLIGTISSATSTTASAILNKALSGAINVAITNVAVLSITGNIILSGTINSSTITEAALIKNIALLGALNTNTTTTASLKVGAELDLSGTISTVTSTLASIIRDAALSGTFTSSTATSSSLIKISDLSGAISSNTVTNLDWLTLDLLLEGQVVITTTTNGILNVTAALVVYDEDIRTTILNRAPVIEINNEDY